jgi:hypothetical protein
VAPAQRIDCQVARDTDEPGAEFLRARWLALRAHGANEAVLNQVVGGCVIGGEPAKIAQQIGRVRAVGIRPIERMASDHRHVRHRHPMKQNVAKTSSDSHMAGPGRALRDCNLSFDTDGAKIG